MRVLVVPMMAMAESSGPASRSRALAAAMVANGWEITLCVPDDSPFEALEGVRLQPLLTPSPLGLPRVIGKNMFPLAQRLGLNRHATITCFDDVLRLTGNTDKRYLAASVKQLRDILRNSHFDAIYSEFNLAAIIAAQAEGVPVFGSTSFPTQPSFASNPAVGSGVNQVLKSLALAPVGSPQDILLWPNMRFVPSCPALEPFAGDASVVFTGPFTRPFADPLTNPLANPVADPGAKGTPQAEDVQHPRNAVVAYLGNGTVTPRQAYAVLAKALQDSNLSLYVAGLPERHEGSFHTAPRFNFSELLPRAAVFVNHGGQNSVMDGITYGAPQLICPGKVFERRFNAESATRTGIGISLEHTDFNVESVRTALHRLLEGGEAFRAAADTLRGNLLALGGTDKVISTIEAALG